MTSEIKSMKPLELSMVLGVYAGIAVISLIWDWLSHGSAFYSWQGSSFPSLLSILISLVFIALYVGLSMVVSLLTKWGQQLDLVFTQLLTPISYFQIAIISLVSGFVEEWFFRGVLMNHFGIMVSSIIFGLCHLILVHPLWIWSLWTFLAGLAFALIYESTNSLLLCGLIHATINGVLITILNLKAYGRWGQDAKVPEL